MHKNQSNQFDLILILKTGHTDQVMHTPRFDIPWDGPNVLYGENEVKDFVTLSDLASIGS